MQTISDQKSTKRTKASATTKPSGNVASLAREGRIHLDKLTSLFSYLHGNPLVLNGARGPEILTEFTQAAASLATTLDAIEHEPAAVQPSGLREPPAEAEEEQPGTDPDEI